jgi:hypothetical protein
MTGLTARRAAHAGNIAAEGDSVDSLRLRAESAPNM